MACSQWCCSVWVLGVVIPTTLSDAVCEKLELMQFLITFVDLCDEAETSIWKIKGSSSKKGAWRKIRWRGLWIYSWRSASTHAVPGVGSDRPGRSDYHDSGPIAGSIGDRSDSDSRATWERKNAPMRTKEAWSKSSSVGGRRESQFHYPTGMERPCGTVWKVRRSAAGTERGLPKLPREIASAKKGSFLGRCNDKWFTSFFLTDNIWVHWDYWSMGHLYRFEKHDIASPVLGWGEVSCLRYDFD